MPGLRPGGTVVCRHGQGVKDLGLLLALSGSGTPTSVASPGHSPFMLSCQNSGRSSGYNGGTAPSSLSVLSPSGPAPSVLEEQQLCHCVLQASTVWWVFSRLMRAAALFIKNEVA
ncbi:zinc finger CCCH domain-containing protein 53-like [Hordeum vulgare]|nr:zinc finger CCCH domain-containing protein 53-like [Hordeum vulgare]